MKRLLYVMAASVASVAMCSMTTGCRMPPPCNDGDTVAASEFEPYDTTSKVHAVQTATVNPHAVIESVGIYYIGDGSTRERLQLVSYPSRRDTLSYGKTRHLRVKGSADYGCVVRVKFYVLNGTDSLVSAIENVMQ